MLSIEIPNFVKNMGNAIISYISNKDSLKVLD